MQITDQSIETTLQHHLQAFLENDIDEIMKDYTDESEVWTQQGTVTGLINIRSFFEYAFRILPRNRCRLDLIQKIVKDNKAYLAWSAESDVVTIPLGSDSFEINDGVIVWHTTAVQIIEK